MAASEFGAGVLQLTTHFLAGCGLEREAVQGEDMFGACRATCPQPKSRYDSARPDQDLQVKLKARRLGNAGR